MSNRVIIVAHEFAPLNRGGVHRLVRFANYLPPFGIEPTVITVKVESYHHEHLDDSILLDPKFDIIRTEIKPKEGPDNYYLSLTDSIGKRWWPYLSIALQEQVKKIQPQAILVTAPPFGMIGLVKKIVKNYDIPVILDLRDAWSNWNFVPFPSKIHYLLTKRAEKQALVLATQVLVTSAQTRADLLQLHGKDLLSKIQIVYNSYEGTIKPQEPVPGKAKIKIGYVGSFYYNPVSQRLIDDPWWKKKPYQFFQFTPRKENWLYRSPYFVFRTVKQLLDRHPDVGNRIQLEFAGKRPDWFDEMVDTFGLQEVVTHHGMLSKEASLNFQQSCDALLLTSSKVMEGRDYSIAGKTFEYFISGKPIVSFVKEGAQKDLLEESGMSLILDPDQIDVAVENLYKWLEGDLSLAPNYEMLERYSAQSTTLALSEIIRDT